MKILFINLPYYGHVVPTIGLVQELIKNNCEVTYLLPDDWKNSLKDSGAKFVGYKNHRQLSEQIKNAYKAAEKIINEYDIVIYEQFFFLGKHLCEKYKKPVVRVFSAPSTTKQLMDEYIFSNGPLHIFKHKWIARAFTKDIAKGIKLKTDNWLDEIVYNPPGLNLVYTLKEYQPYYEEFNKEQFKFIGPSIYERESQTFNFHKTNKPVIYISLGTILKGAKSFYQNCIEAFRNENIDVIISVGKKFNMSQLKNIPEHIHIYNFVPQTQVLNMADVFITHGGMNSISESLVSETPMIIIPFHSDQPINANSMQKLGVGYILDYKYTSIDRLNKTVMNVLNDENIKKNILSMKKLINQSQGNSGAAKMIIEYYNQQKME